MTVCRARQEILEHLVNLVKMELMESKVTKEVMEIWAMMDLRAKKVIRVNVVSPETMEKMVMLEIKVFRVTKVHLDRMVTKEMLENKATQVGVKNVNF